MTTLRGLAINPLPPRCVQTHYEIKVIQDGRPTPLRERHDTLNLAREAATYKAKLIGTETFFELDPGENFSDATADGVYLVTVRTETVARAI